MGDKKPNLRSLGSTLQQMEQDDPVVKAAGERYDATVKQILERRVHRLPCLDLSCTWHHDL